MSRNGDEAAFPRYSACLEMLFVKESADFAERIHMAGAAGFEAVEFWSWMDKDIPAIGRALTASGVRLAGMVAEPMIWLTEPANHTAFLDGLARSVECAHALGAPILIAQAGDDVAGRERDAIVSCLARGANILRGSGVTLALEPLNTLVDHPGYFLSSTAEGFAIVDLVDRPEIRLLYDAYHSMVMGEEPQQVLAGQVDKIAHVHLADHPGRNEPGSGRLPLREVTDWLTGNGYAGLFGLEFCPTGSTAQGLAAVATQLLETHRGPSAHG